MSQLATRGTFNNNSLSTEASNGASVPKRFFLRINKGFEKGAVFQVKSGEVLIGREPSNHIQLKNDPKVSRKHVRLIYSNGKYIIQDITKNNFITVNGLKVKQAELRHNQVINIGGHSLQYIVSTNIPQSEKKEKSSASNPNTQRVRLILVALVLAGGAFFFLSQEPQKKSSPLVEHIENAGIVDERIQDIEETISQLDEEIKSSNKFDEIGRSAHSIYLQGKRDFDRGQYLHSISAFEAVLSLSPDHSNARRYLRLANQYFSQILEIQFRDGLTNKNTGRYEQCKGAMKNIMNLVNDPSNPRYKEAHKIFMECDLKETAGEF